MSTKKEREQQEAVRILKEWGLVDGTEVNAEVVQVSASGMSRRVRLFIVRDGRLADVTYWAARALEWTYCDTFPRGVRVGGCGMDMLFHTIDSLSHAMGYGPICQEHTLPEPSMKRVGWDKEKQEPVEALAIGLRYRAI